MKSIALSILIKWRSFKGHLNYVFFRDQIRVGNPDAFFVLNGDVCADFPLKVYLTFILGVVFLTPVEEPRPGSDPAVKRKRT